MLYWYPVMVLPPSLPGVNATDALVAPTCTDVMVGAPGTATGVWLFELDGAPVPLPFTASISTEYGVPSVRPEMVIGLEVDVVATPRSGAVELVEVAGDRGAGARRREVHLEGAVLRR